MQVDGTAWLHSKAAAAAAVQRYEQYWLPVLAAHCREHPPGGGHSGGPDSPAVAAPLDVAWAWLAHSLAPSAYSNDFQALTGLAAVSAGVSVPHRRSEKALAAVRPFIIVLP